jgi:NAD(P)-dependent dehydrogenase (short-subunit alcohol dehydrogenase family)
MAPKTVLITGCGQQSIGTALAKEFRSRGHTVFATAWDLSRTDPSLSEMGCHVVELDVTSTTSIDNAVKLVTSATGGHLDILVNNAGIMHIMPFADTPVEEARRVFEVNVLGTWAVTRAFLPLLVAAGKAGSGRSKVVNFSSVNEVLCPPFVAAYSASKAAVESASRTMRRELAPLGVQVVTLKLGSVESGLFNAVDVNKTAATCPEGSAYAGLWEWIARREFLRSAGFAKKEVVARDLVDDLLKENTSAMIWRGGLATIHWFLSFGWETMFVSACSRWYSGFTLTLDWQDRILIKESHLDTMSWSPPEK